MTLRISQLKSYQAFRIFLRRVLKGCSQLHVDKLIKHLYNSYVNDFGVDRGRTATLTKIQFFGDKKGMGRWLKALDKALVIRRTRKNASTFYLSSKGVEYFQKMYKETIVIQKQEVYTAEQKPVVSTDTEQPKGKKMDKALKIIATLTATNQSQQKSIANLTQAFKTLTHEEIEALPPALRIVAKNGELV